MVDTDCVDPKHSWQILQTEMDERRLEVGGEPKRPRPRRRISVRAIVGLQSPPVVQGEVEG